MILKIYVQKAIMSFLQRRYVDNQWAIWDTSLVDHWLLLADSSLDIKIKIIKWEKLWFKAVSYFRALTWLPGKTTIYKEQDVKCTLRHCPIALLGWHLPKLQSKCIYVIYEQFLASNRRKYLEIDFLVKIFNLFAGSWSKWIPDTNTL